MALLFSDGFDKYGTPTNQTVASNTTTALLAEWTSSGGGLGIVSGLSSIGYALVGSNGTALTKTLAASYSRLIGGVRFQSTLQSAAGVVFQDAGTAQCSVTINLTGQLSVRSGAVNATAIATSTQSISQSSTHYLEWDITFGASAAYQVWLDGVSILSGTGNTRGGTSNNSANQIQLFFASTTTYDDFYLLDTTGSTNNAVLLTSPQIETQFPTGDSSVQFSFGAAVLGQATQGTSATGNIGANALFLRPFTTPAVTTVLGSISLVPSATFGGANLKATLYADSAGVPGSLIATGAQATGLTINTPQTSSFSSGQTLTASTAYWLGFICDTLISLNGADTLNSGQAKSNTYGSGAPNPASTMTATGQVSWLMYGNLSSTGVNWFEEQVNPPPGDVSYVFDSTTGHEDLYSFPALTIPSPATIYSVVVKGYIKRSDSGARGVTIQCNSSSTDSGGATVTPGTTYGWIDANFDTDPNGSIAWTGTAVNAATSGFKVAS